MTDDFNKLQNRLKTAVQQFEKNKCVQDVDGLKMFDKITKELRKIVEELSFLSIVDTDINVQALGAALSQAETYLKLSKDQYLVCDGIRPRDEKKNDVSQLLSFGTFFQRVLFRGVVNSEMRTATPSPVSEE